MKAKNSLISLLVLTFLIILNIPAYAISYVYDDVGRIVSVTYNSGKILHYSYDAGGNMTAISNTQDTTAPTIVNTSPNNGAIEVGVSDCVYVIFDENIYKSVNMEGLTITDGETTVDFVYGISGNVLRLDPVTDLEQGKTYTVTIPGDAVKDGAGNNFVAAYSFSFTTQSGTDTTTPSIAPTIVSTNPSNGDSDVAVSDTVYVAFDKNISESLNVGAIALTDGETAVDFVYGISDNVMTIDPITDLEQGKTYTLTIPADAVKDEEGNSFAAEYSFSFSTLPVQ